MKITEKESDSKQDEIDCSEVEAQIPSEESEARPKSRWSTVLEIAQFVTAVAIMWGFGLLLGFGLPKIATPRILDVVWMSLVGYQTWFTYNNVSSVFNKRGHTRC